MADFRHITTEDGTAPEQDYEGVSFHGVSFLHGEPKAEKEAVDLETQRYVDSELRAVKAENNANFSRLEGKIDGLPRPPGIWQIAGVVAAGITFMIGVLAFASDRFDGGISASSVVDDALQRVEVQQEARDARQDERLDEILRVLSEDRASRGAGSSNSQD